MIDQSKSFLRLLKNGFFRKWFKLSGLPEIAALHTDG